MEMIVLSLGYSFAAILAQLLVAVHALEYEHARGSMT